MMTHDYFNGGSFIRSAIYDLPKIQHPIRYVPWCTGVYRKHIRYVPFCLGVFRHQLWFTIRNESGAVSEREFSRLRFLWDNKWDEATVTTNSEQLKFPAADTQHHWLSRCWRSAESKIKGIWLKADFGEAKSVRALVVANHWFNPGSTVIIQANNADAWGAPAINQELEIIDDKTLIEYFWDTEQNYRYWRLYMTVGSVTGSLTGEEDISTRGDRDMVPYCKPHFKIGRIFLGDYFEVSQNFIENKPEYEEDSQEYKTDREGHISERPMWKFRDFFYTFDKLGSSDYDTIWDIYESKGKGIPFFIIENYRYWWKRTYYVTFSESLEYEYLYNRVNTTLHFKETR